MTALTNYQKGKFTDALIILVVILILMMWLSSCTTYKKCIDKFGTGSDTVMVERTDTIHFTTTVAIPYENVTGTIKLKQKYDSMIAVSANGRARAIFWKDKYDSIRFIAECLPDTVLIDTVIYHTIEVPIQVNTFAKPKEMNWIQRFSMNIGGVVLVLALSFVLFKISKWAINAYFPGFKILNLFK